MGDILSLILFFSFLYVDTCRQSSETNIIPIKLLLVYSYPLSAEGQTVCKYSSIISQQSNLLNYQRVV